VAGLPLVGLGFAALLGAGPVHVLLGTSAGSACLAGGVLLDLLGLRWLRWTGDRVARRAEPPTTWASHRRSRSSGGRPTASSRPGRRAVATGRRRLLADLPLALDLVAACLAAGATVPAALEATADGVGGPLGAELLATARGLRLGAPAGHMTARLMAAGQRPPGPLPPLSRRATGHRGPGRGQPLAAAAQALGRVETSGARLADALTSIAARARAQSHDEAIGAARRAGVAAVAPLGLCFLPAFLLLGVVPTILGSFHGLFPAS
jgi:tight adherence protein B